MRGHSAKTRVNALVTRASIFLRRDGLPGQSPAMAIKIQYERKLL
jgi:hypothetical protein